MTSTLTWLDSSPDEQRRMRELLNLFTQTETLDELGIGQIRDTFSDLLFPGTSTLLTRARYFLIVPWCYMDAGGRKLSEDRFNKRVDRTERELIKHMRDAGVRPGLIGAVAGPGVKTLPSALYWNALAAYGIRLTDQPILSGRSNLDPESELTQRVLTMWHPTTPAPPSDFPHTLDGGLQLQREEAAWLRERIIGSVRESLLAQLLLQPDRLLPDSSAPWAEPAASHASPTSQRVLRHAELFSGALHGASLLYNLLIAEEYEAAGLTRVPDPVESYLAALDDWTSQVTNDGRYATWDQDEMWELLRSQNWRVGTNTMARGFVSTWLDAVVSGGVHGGDVARNGTLRGLVAARERHVKKAQSRLANSERLRAWSGSSGAGSLTFRWTQVRRILLDIQEGLELEVTDADA